MKNNLNLEVIKWELCGYKPLNKGDVIPIDEIDGDSIILKSICYDDTKNNDWYYTFIVNDEGFVYNLEWGPSAKLKFTTKPVSKNRDKMIDGYDCEYLNDDRIKIGCQNIRKDTAISLAQWVLEVTK